MEELINVESEKVIAVLKEYFTAEEWKELPEALRSRYLNTTRNYVDGPSGAIFFPMPDFMKNKKKLSEKSPDVADDAVFLKPTSMAPRRKKINSEPERRNPKRTIPEKNYYEEEEPPEDRYVYCDVCEKEYLDYCTNCGMLVSLEDNPVRVGEEDRAKKTAPKGVLEVRRSQIHGFGVFALKNLKMGIRMGPYQGETTRIDTKKGYAWKLRDGRLIDASDESNSNYLRFVNCARNAEEQNLVAFQYKGNLYYRTCKKILKDEELLVFYGVSFAKNLGIDPKKYFEPVQEEVVEYYTCKFCHIGLSTKDYLEKHQMKYCRFNPLKMEVYDGELYKCEYCKVSITSPEFLKRHIGNCWKRISDLKTRKNQLVDRSDANLEKKFECKYCDFKSRHRDSLQKHVLAIHEKQNAQWYYCDKCEYKTCFKRYLQWHSRIHEKFGRLKCEKCQKEFNFKHSLDCHTLKYHPDISGGITRKIHFCDFCDYKSLNVSNLTEHKFKHNKENAPIYKCSKCDYFSNYKQNLKQHFLIHSGNTPYICIECKKGCITKSQLDWHIFTKHKNKEHLLRSITSKFHKCSLCKYETIYISRLKTHLKSHK